MTFPRVVNDLLMFAPSLSRCPVAPVEFARSEPARSTKLYIRLESDAPMREGSAHLIRDTFSVSKFVARSRFFIVRRSVKTAWEREELLNTQFVHEGPTETSVRFVHVRRRYRTCFISLVHESHHFIIATHSELAEILDIGSQTRMLANT